jgi:uncharacterized repeat protein (TIGR01451 family)
MKMVRLKTVGSFVFFLALAFTQAAIAQDFSLNIQPGSLTLVPGQSASFVVALTPIGGFTNPVTLSVTNLPAAVTATFSPQTLTPPGTSLLTLSATTNATDGSFELGLTAIGGGITNTATSSVSVSFGLLPVCYGAFQGTVTDTTTGLPVPYAVVTAEYSSYYTATADANGQFLITNIALGSSENLPVDYYITATRSNYWSSYTYSYAVCDATNTVNLQILAEKYGSISGTLTAQGGQPLTNVTVYAEGQSYVSTNTDALGNFQFQSLVLNNDNVAANYTVYSQPTGYWQVSTNTTVQANSNSVVNLVAIPICYATVSGSVVYGDTGLPATNLSVAIVTYTYAYATTDSNGNYTATNVELNANNAAVNATVESSAPGYYEAYTNVEVSTCGQSVGAPVLRLTRIPVVTNNYGAVTGHVYDLLTLQPITNAYVSDYYAGVYADTNGAYLITNVLVGTGSTTNQYYNIYASATGYFQSVSNLTIYAGQTATQDLYLLRIGYGFVQGTVLDSATGLPVSNIYVSISGHYTGADGHYASGPLQLSSGNVPTYESFYAQGTGYWQVNTNTTITNGITNVVNIEIIKVCTGATIIGNVVNANTSQPITNATLTVYSPYESVMTDTNGNFILTNITVGNNNSPIQTTVYATAPGFNPQNKTVTIFCDAVISTEFGAPETAFGAIDGYVTNVVTGQPLTNVFIGSGFGEATTTDTNGYYILSQAPLSAGGASRTWTVTAAPTGYPAQTESVVVSSNVTSRLDFGFGQPPTDLFVTATGSPDPVMVGSNLLYTITLSNSVAGADNVLLTNTLPPGVTFVGASLSNNPDGAFGAPILTNGQVQIFATNFSSNATVVLLINVTPTAPGTLTNIAGVTTTTTPLTPGNTNLSATVTTVVTTPPPPAYAFIGVSVTGLPNPDVVGDSLVYTITVTNSGVDAQNVWLTNTLPAGVTFFDASFASNPGNEFGPPTQTGNQVTIFASDFSSNSAAVLLITVIPQVVGTLTDVATVAADNLSPADTNLTAIVTNSAALPYADVGVWMTSVPSYTVVISNQLTYTLNVTNFGPVDAPDVLLIDTLPDNVILTNLTNFSQGSYILLTNGLQWDLGPLTNQGTASATIVVVPQVIGLITNTATVSIPEELPSTVVSVHNNARPAVRPVVTDPNPTNNTASVTNLVIAPSPTNFWLGYGPLVTNRQTGLIQQTVLVSNLSGLTAAGVRVVVLDLPGNVQLYNSTGTTNEAPYVEYDQSITNDGSVEFLLEYYVPTRVMALPTNFDGSLLGLPPAVIPLPTGTVLQLDNNSPFLYQGQSVIEFTSVPGDTYVVEYRDGSSAPWLAAATPIVAVNNRTQWIDAGPPETVSIPVFGQRLYQIVLTTH